ncbi:hypothetical protein ACOMHN_000207 [Nucella lapillus]
MKNPKFTKLLALVLCTSSIAFSHALETDQENEKTPQSSWDKNGDPVRSEPPPKGPSNSSRPHIVMIVVDDLGWNDVDWRDSSLHTPVLRQLAAQGVVLNQSYVQPVCSPSRAAFLSGFYPYHMGLQHDSLRATQKAYMPGNITTLPQHLQKLGYRTHMAGKWHLGFCNWQYTPTYRGFDSFVGFYNAIQDYYTHIGHHKGYDFRHNKDVYYKANGTYSAFIFTQYIEQVIAQHNLSEPLFVYLPYQSVHGPLQVPQSYVDRYCSHIHDTDRRSKCAMIAALDEGIGNVTRALRKRGIFDDTLLLVTTDNGGPVTEGANNWPLRGSKHTLWEGGTRATAFLHAPRYFPGRAGTVYDGVIHAVDWLPTLVEAAGGPAVEGLDGVSQWPSLLQAKVPSARTEFLYNMDELRNNSALRQGRFKLLQGHPGHPDQWYPPPKLRGEVLTSLDNLQENPFAYLPESLAEQYFEDRFTETEFRIEDFVRESRFPSNGSFPLFGRFQNVRRVETETVVRMTSEGDVTAAGRQQYQLYDLEADPTEHHDVKDKYPEVFQRMKARLEEYQKSLVPANFPPHDPAALPSNFHGVWSPGWC